MGISAGGSKGGPKSEMNITPLVDVVLVLLVIFMVSMPVMMRSVTIEVPRDLDEENEAPVAMTTVIVKGLADGKIDISDGVIGNNVIITRGELAKTLLKRLEKTDLGKKTVFVDFEDDVLWEQVVSIMDTVKGVGAVSAGDDMREDIKIAIQKRKKTPTPN